MFTTRKAMRKRIQFPYIKNETRTRLKPQWGGGGTGWASFQPILTLLIA